MKDDTKWDEQDFRHFDTLRWGEDDKTIYFPDWVHECFESEDLRLLASGVWDRIREELATPDVNRFTEPQIALTDTGNASEIVPDNLGSFLCRTEGPLVREDRIYAAFPGQERDLLEVLDRLHQSGWIVGGLFLPTVDLTSAFEHAYDATSRTQGRKPKGPPISPLGACSVLAKGDLRAASLLYQIRYWRGKAKPWFGGHRWIAKTAEVWAAETCLSISRYHRALRRLKDLELIESEQHLFSGKAVTFLRTRTFLGIGCDVF